MKWVLAWVAALLLGAAAGWRGDGGVAGGTALVPSEPVAQPAPVLDQRGVDLGSDAFGEGWRSWADRVLAAETSADLERLFHELAASEDGKLKSTINRLLVARWAEVAPAEGVRFLVAEGGSSLPLQGLLTEWVLIDPVAGLKELELHGTEARSSVPDGVQARLCRRNPKAALEMIRARRKYARYPRSSLKPLAAAYPDELAALIVEIETERLASGERYGASSYIEAVAKEMANRDPEAARDWAEGLEGKMQSTARRAVIRRWAESDPHGYAEYCKSRGENLDNAVRKKVEKALAGNDIDAIIKLASKGGRVDDSLSQVLAQQIDQGALTFEEAYDKMSGGEAIMGRVRIALMQDVWPAMSSAELGGALELLLEKPAAAGRETAIEGLMGNWLARDQEAAMAAVAALPAGESRDAVVGSMLDWSDLRHSSRSVRTRIGMLPVEDRALAIGGLLEAPNSEGVPGGFDPRNFAETLAGTPDDAARAVAVERLGAYWGSVDPEWAMDWAMGLGGDESARAVAAVAKGWAPHDLFSLSNALLEMPAGPVRGSATGVLVETLTESEPDSAWQWAQQIDDPAARQSVVEAWAKKDAEAAGDAVEAADLSAAEREALRAVLRR